MLEQPLPRNRTHARNVIELADPVAHLPSFAVVGHREAVTLIADALDHVQHRAAAVQDYRVVFLAVHVDDLLALGD